MINTNPYYNPYAYGISQNLSTGMNNQIPAPMASNDIQKNPVAAPQEKKTSFLLSIQFALFLYRLKWNIFNRH